MLPPDGLYLHGRVISTAANAGGFKNSILIYIYKERSDDKDSTPVLRPRNLLVPPIMTNKQPWSRGYFEFVRHEELRLEDRLRNHCFREALRGWYFDEVGKRLPNPVEPIGDWGLHSYRTIDDEVSRALGIELAPQ